MQFERISCRALREWPFVPIAWLASETRSLERNRSSDRPRAEWVEIVKKYRAVLFARVPSDQVQFLRGVNIEWTDWLRRLRCERIVGEVDMPECDDAENGADHHSPAGTPSEVVPSTLGVVGPEPATSAVPIAPNGGTAPQYSHPSSASLFLSTLLSLSVILILLVSLRFLLPSMVEFSRYSWHRGQLRAEYDMAGNQLERISWDGLTNVSKLVAKRVCPSVVQVTLTDPQFEEARRSGLPVAGRIPSSGQGSGVVVDERGYLLTNYHVLTDSKNKISGDIIVVLPDQRRCPATVIGTDNLTDLAVLHIDADNLLPITWGDSDSIETGSPVWAVGSPFGLTGSITFGIISSKHRLDLSGTTYRRRESMNPTNRPYSEIEPRYSDLMQSDVAVNPGNSGGPLVNGKGELIGINTAIIGESYQGVSFSIPSSTARLVFDQIMESGKMKRGWLGVELVKPSIWERMKPGAENSDDESKMPSKGAVVRFIVNARSPAAKAGLAVGDHILAVNDEPASSVDELINKISRTHVGTTIVLSIERSGEPKKISVTVGERPETSP